jgi:hypothetical protein
VAIKKEVLVTSADFYYSKFLGMENLVKSAVKVGLLMVALENSQSNGTF